MTQLLPHLLIAGAGIGGLGAALALARAGVRVTVLEQTDAFGEVGAGVQVSPNAFAVLSGWGLREALLQVANFPLAMQARDAATHRLLGQIDLGDTARSNYGFDYACIHRADLHQVLLDAVRQQPLVTLQLNAKIVAVSELAQAVQVSTEQGASHGADALIGCDGLWSQVRQHVLGAQPPLATGHVAWRALLPMRMVPSQLQSQRVIAWLAPHMHAVAYPVRRSQFLNVVVVTEDDNPASTPNPQSWSRDATGLSPLESIKNSNQPVNILSDVLSNLLQKVTEPGGGGWTRWTLFDRDPVRSSQELAHPAHPRLALLGDAAHPMRPYLAQGAAMALEDAQALAMAISQQANDLPAALQLYARQRWQRNARVQARSRRSGAIFHLEGPLRWGRDTAMGLFGHRLMDLPWLYKQP
ncbi:MAG: FAD-dependent monooxygenase [Burkholderiaceae bacterium]|nr:FAD-dependent monooxygenase [Burkholderiaceae bacterium]